MINKDFWVVDEYLDVLTTFNDADAAREYASENAMNNGSQIGVMLKVPVVGFPELRLMVLYDEQGRIMWETSAYNAELVG